MSKFCTMREPIWPRPTKPTAALVVVVVAAAAALSNREEVASGERDDEATVAARWRRWRARWRSGSAAIVVLRLCCVVSS